MLVKFICWEDSIKVTLVKDFIHELEKKIDELSNGKKSKIIKEWTKN